MLYAEKRPGVLDALDGLRAEKAGAAGHIILDRPPLNVVSYPARAQIAALIEEMDRDPEIRVIVIRGANGVYTSGGDIAGFLEIAPDGAVDLAWNVAAPERARKPVIAAMEKFAMGVGFELALACDFRLATEATEMALPEINLGVIPGSGGTQRIARLAGLGRAKEMIMRGRRVKAPEAYQWGLVSAVVPNGGLDAAIACWVADLAARPMLPMQSLKAVLNDAYETPLSAGLRAEGQAFEKLRTRPEFRHGVESFLAKKKPNWGGR